MEATSTSMRFALGALAGAVLAGGTLVATWPAPAEAVPEADVPVVAPAPVASFEPQRWVRSSCPPPPAVNRTLGRRLEASRAALDAVEVAFADALGEPQAFPDDLDPRFLPAEARDTVLDGLPEDAELVELTCDEYPCIATLLTSEALPEAYLEGIGATTIHHSPREGAHRYTVPLGGPEDPGARLHRRMKLEASLLESQVRE